MHQPLVAGNWKLHGTRDRVTELADAIVAGLADVEGPEVAVCPTFVHVPLVAERAAGTALAVGAQDVSDQVEGAFTGEVAAPMLAELGCRYVIVGHSERRARHGETDAGVAAKFHAACAAGLRPILCVGETLAQRDAGATLEVVGRQLGAVLAGAGDGVGDAVIAYEPVWAIGTGRTASPEQAQEVHAALRATLADTDDRLARRVRILYGGSVKAANATELFAMKDIDGALVGGASLDPHGFLEICRSAAATAA